MKPIFCVLLFALTAVAAFGQVPRNINYQGVLTDQNGVPVDAPKSIQFRIFNVATGGTAIYSQGPQTIQVRNGVFNVVLGPIQLPFDVPYFLETVVEGSTLIPRAALGSAPYGIRAARADSAGHADHAANSDHSTRSDTSNRADHANNSDHSSRSDTSNRASRSNRADTTDLALGIGNNTVTTAKILDGTISMIDIGQNGAATGQVIKWNGTSWAASADEGAGAAASGWTDDGTIVRLSGNTDNVGIGTSTPSEKLEVSGNAKVTNTLFASSVSSFLSPSTPLKLQTAGIDRVFISDVNGNVGIGTSAPVEALDVTGNVRTSSLVLSGNGSLALPAIRFSGDPTTGLFMPSTQQVALTTGGTSRVTVSNTNVSVSTPLSVSSDLSVNTNKFNVAASTGNTTIAGTLGVTGNTTVAGTLGVTSNLAVNTNKFNVTATTGSTTIAGTLAIGGGTPIVKVLSGTATLDFLATAAATNSVLTITVTGAVVGDVVSLGIPFTTLSNNTAFTAWVSAANIVTVRFQNSSTVSVDPAAGVFRAAVIRF